MKNFNKKIRKLEARIKKDMKKLSKLKRKLAEAAKPPTKTKTAVSKQQAKPAKASPRVAKTKKKRNLSPEARAKLASLMKARWDAKRSAARSNAGSGDAPPPIVGNS